MNKILISISLIFLIKFYPSFTQHESHMYVPIHSLHKSDICSIMSIATAPVNSDDYWRKRADDHHSRRTMLYFLLSIKSAPNNHHLLKLIDECRPGFDWSIAKKNYLHLKTQIEPYQKQYKAENLGTYWQLNIPNSHSGVVNSRKYISRYRSRGFQPNELKIYWNYQQLHNLASGNHYNPISDSDTKNALFASPVSKRKHSGRIKFVINGIEDAVFHVPKGKQVIVLDFADERMPGGYYLEDAKTQEEVILYNSDGYRALLDFKYKMMDGGYILPEFGVGYVKRVRFFRKYSSEERLTDLIVAACYDLSFGGREGLYQPPSARNLPEVRSRTLKKFQAMIASAVANTEGDGRNTYLLLGPIGTGAFGNDKQMIAKLFHEVLNNPLMTSKEAIKYAFDQIWFVSTDNLDVFEKVFQYNEY